MERFRPTQSAEKGKSSIEKMRNLKGALFGAFLSSVSAHHAEAADFSSGTRWQEGSTTLQHAAQHEPNEFAGLYIETTGARGHWQNAHTGDKDSVAMDFTNDEIAILTALSKNIDTPSMKVCVAHTHPNTFAEGYLYGPSVADLNVDVAFTEQIQRDVLASTDVHVDVEGIVFEKHGVWYYAPSKDVLTGVPPKLTPNEVSKTTSQSFAQTIEDPHHTASDLLMRTIGVTLALAQQGMNARFVPYKDFFAEPPCAGVSYKGSK